MQTPILRSSAESTGRRCRLALALAVLAGATPGCGEDPSAMAASDLGGVGERDAQETAAIEPAVASAPKNTRAAAVPAPPGVTEGLTLGAGEEDWYRIVVPAHTIVRVGIQFQRSAGDLDLVAYDEAGDLVGSRYGDVYPYSYRQQETNSEVYGFYSEHGGAPYYLRVVGYEGAQNHYDLHVDSFPYVDGASCTGAGFTFDQCAGQGADGSGLLPFPFPDPDDSAINAGYVWESMSNYRFARRELIMLVRDALSKTFKAFPGTRPLSLLDVCQIDGITPGYDVGEPRHPETTHDQGGNIDIAYFQTDGSNDGQIICGDGSQHEDGYCSPAAAQKHIVDLDREAFFMAQLFSSPRTRVVGVDRVIAPLLAKAAAALHARPDGDPKKISASQLSGFTNKIAYGSGWPYHHHHIHLSMKWWPANTASPGELDDSASPVSHLSPEAPPDLRMTWPPRGE